MKRKYNISNVIFLNFVYAEKKLTKPVAFICDMDKKTSHCQRGQQNLTNESVRRSNIFFSSRMSAASLLSQKKQNRLHG